MAHGSRFIAGAAGENSHRKHRDHQRRATRGNHRQGDPGDRQQADDVADVDQCLRDHPDGDRRGDQTDIQIARAAGDPQARICQKREEHQDQCAAHEAQFFADDREDVVRMRVGQCAPLGAAVAEPHPEHAAGAQRVEALDCLVPGSLSVGPRIQERQQAVHPEALGRDSDEADGQYAADHQPEQAERRADHPEQREEDDQVGDGGVQIGLNDHQAAQQREPRNDRLEHAVPGVQDLAPLDEHVRTPQQERDLANLRRLKQHNSGQVEPTPGAVDLPPDAGDEHQSQQHDRRDHHHACQPPPLPHRDPHRRHHHDDAEDDEDELTVEQVVRRPVRLQGVDG